MSFHLTILYSTTFCKSAFSVFLNVVRGKNVPLQFESVKDEELCKNYFKMCTSWNLAKIFHLLFLSWIITTLANSVCWFSFGSWITVFMGTLKSNSFIPTTQITLTLGFNLHLNTSTHIKRSYFFFPNLFPLSNIHLSFSFISQTVIFLVSDTCCFMLSL